MGRRSLSMGHSQGHNRLACEQDAQFFVCCVSRLRSVCRSMPANMSLGVAAAAPSYWGPPPPCLLSHLRSAVTPLHQTAFIAQACAGALRLSGACGAIAR